MVEIKPREAFRILLVYPNLAMMLVPSIAIALFTNIFKSLGYQLDLFDTTHYVSEENSSPQNRVKYLQARDFSERKDLGVTIKTDLLKDFSDKVLEFKPDLLVISIVEDVFLQAIKMLSAVKELNIPHLIGGVFPTAAPERCMEFPQINLIGIGEGEKTVERVAECIRTRTTLENIPGIWFKETDGKILKNSMDNLVDINAYRPDFSLYDEARFYRPMGGKIFRTLPVETYRGCPYSCTYCNSPMQKKIPKENKMGSYLRRKSIPKLRDELRDLIDRFRPEFFYFVDDSFLARPKGEINDFCEMYKEFRLPFWFNTRPENCDMSSLNQLRDVGCYRISFGIECGNEEFRKKILKRDVSNNQMLKKFEIIAKSDIAFSLNLIIGFPGETRDLVMDTVELSRSISGYDTLTVSIFTPYSGTVLREVAVKNHWLDKKVITKHTTSRSMLTMPYPYLSADDIDGLMRVIPLYCFFPKNEWERIRRAEIDDEEGNEILRNYSRIYKEKFLKTTQEEEKEILVLGGTGCVSNPKDSLRVSPSRLTCADIEMLTLSSC